MKFFKAAKALSTALALTLTFNFHALAAPVINDVDTSHWAYEYISEVLEKQYMSLNQDGNFKPNDPLNKFDTARILAGMMGYKYNNATEAELSYYEGVYQKYKNLLSSYSSKFVRWNSSTDREIAFLLDKEILIEEDLYQFVIMNQDGGESLRALSREEAAVFITKVIGKKSEALGMTLTYDFLDDSTIDPAFKPYVYYFKAKQVVLGEDGKFNPKSAVSRVALSVMISKAVALVGGSLPNSTSFTANNQTVQAPQRSIITGTIDMVFPNLNNVVQVIPSGGEPILYKIAQSAVITINNMSSSPSMLASGMTFIGTIANNEFVEIKAENPIAAVTPMPTAQPTTSQTDQTQAVTNESKVMEGIVSAVQNTASGQQILVERSIVSPRGDIVPEILIYDITPGCVITRGDEAISTADIQNGEIIKLTVNGNAAIRIALEERNINIEGGTLIEKRYHSVSDSYYFVIEDKNKKTYELRVTDQTQLRRSTQGDVSFDQIRLGDVVDATAEFDKLISLQAYGVISTQDGTIQEIYIGKSSSTVTVMTDDNLLHKYTVIPGLVDVYSIKLNDKVRLRLDSWEVESISILQVAATNYVTGFIQYIRAQSFSFQDITMSPGMTKDIYFDSSTVVVNSRTGDKVDISHLRNGMKVYVNLSAAANAPAKTITILLD